MRSGISKEVRELRLLHGKIHANKIYQMRSLHIDAFINGNRDFINYRLSCTIYQFQKNFACFPFRVMALEQSPLRKQCESVDVSNPRRTRLRYLITLVPLHRVLFRREGKGKEERLVLKNRILALGYRFAKQFG